MFLGLDGVCCGVVLEAGMFLHPEETLQLLSVLQIGSGRVKKGSRGQQWVVGGSGRFYKQSDHTGGERGAGCENLGFLVQGIMQPRHREGGKAREVVRAVCQLKYTCKHKTFGYFAVYHWPRPRHVLIMCRVLQQR